ncbi:MAG: DUF4388 domain-containing protein [Actinomycetota bacterium]
MQGSLDDFALDEMLTLLASTGKTGRLEVKGDRGQGALRLKDGRLVDATASNTANGTEPEDALFELLRFTDGNFHFTVSEEEDGTADIVVAEAVIAAEERLADWKTIEAVVPSLRHMVTPVRELPENEVTLDRGDWAAIITIGNGCPVSAVCEELDLGEVEGSRCIKGLIERGLVSIGEPKSTGLRRSGLDAVRAAASSAASSPAPSGPAINPLPATVGAESQPLATTSNGNGNGNGNGSSPAAEMSAEAAGAPMAGAANPILEGENQADASGAEAESAPVAGAEPAPAAPPAPTAADASTMPPPSAEAAASADADADRAQPPHPESVPGGPAPTSGLSTLAPAVRQPLDGGTNERSGGLLMRYLKNDD